MRNEPIQKLQMYIADIFPDKESPRVSDLTNISAGWESDVHAFTLTHGSREDKRCEEVILRIYQGDDAHTKSAREFNGMQWLYRAGYPVPRVLILEREASPFDKPFVLMERIDGAAMVINWTQIEISDARFDLAWTLLLLGTQEGPEWRDRILCEYERIIGEKVEEIEYFEVIACVKRLATVATVLAGDAEQIGMRPEAVGLIREQLDAMGRVYALLQERTGIAVTEIEEILKPSPFSGVPYAGDQ